MNLYLLVEGRRTEARIYHSWIARLFPGVRLAERPEDVTENCFRLISGGGYYRPVSYFFAGHGFSPEECRDLAQETFINVFKGIGTFRAETRRCLMLRLQGKKYREIAVAIVPQELEEEGAVGRGRAAGQRPAAHGRLGRGLGGRAAAGVPDSAGGRRGALRRRQCQRPRHPSRAGSAGSVRPGGS